MHEKSICERGDDVSELAAGGRAVGERRMKSIIFSLWNVAMITNVNVVGVADPLAPAEEWRLGDPLTGCKGVVRGHVGIRAVNEAERARFGDQLQTPQEDLLVFDLIKQSSRSLPLGRLRLGQKGSWMMSDQALKDLSQLCVFDDRKSTHLCFLAKSQQLHI